MTKAQEVGKRIAQARRHKAVRDESDVRPADVARALKVSQATVSDWESGKTTPRDELMERLAKFLGVSPGFLRYGESSPRSALDGLAREPEEVAKPANGKHAARKAK